MSAVDVRCRLLENITFSFCIQFSVLFRINHLVLAPKNVSGTAASVSKLSAIKREKFC